MRNLIIIRNSAVIAVAGAVGCRLASGTPIIISLIWFFPMAIVAYLLGFPWGKPREHFPWVPNRKETKAISEETQFYDQVAKELNENNLIPGLWTKAFAEMNGDEAKVKALYIRYRVQQLQIERQIQTEKRQAERDRETALAKPKLSDLMKVIHVICGLICGAISLILGLGCLVGMFDPKIWNGGPTDIAQTACGFLFGIGLASAFGWVTFKCFKAL